MVTVSSKRNSRAFALTLLRPTQHRITNSFHAGDDLMQLRIVMCAGMLVAPGIAAAQMPLPSFEQAPPLSGLYIGAGVGVNWLQNEHLVTTAGTAVNGSI